MNHKSPAINMIKITYRSITSTLLLLFLYGMPLTAQITDPYPPGPSPDRVILTWSDSPDTTQSVSWRTDVSVINPVAQIAEAGGSPDFAMTPLEIAATTETITSSKNVAFYHSVTFKDLKPNTMYAYRVGSKRNWSEWFQFETASSEEEPFSFLYFGDAQNNIKSMWSRCIRQAFMTMPDIDFMIHAGDLVNIANEDSEWGEWFHAGGWLYGTKAHIACPGNHEYYKSSTEVRALSNLWKPTFTFPQNGPEGLEETVFYIDYQGTRIIALNTMSVYAKRENLEKQKTWLKKVLKENPNKWTIVTHHHPIYSTKFGRDNPEIRAAFQPLYEKYGVDIVLQGHDHSYGRGHNVEFGQKESHQGPIYVVSVSGPKMYDLGFDEWLERAAANTQLYQLITVDDNKLKFEAYTAIGELYDAFTLQKESNGTNTFIDEAPEGMEELIDLPERVYENMSEEEVTKFRTRLEAYKERRANGKQ